MFDLRTQFNELLKSNQAPPTEPYIFSVNQAGDFLQEAYRINSLISSLHSQLQDIRQAYLSAAPPRKTHLRGRANQEPELHLTDHEREAFDADAKRFLQNLHFSIRGLAEAEELRQKTQQAVIEGKHGSAFAGLGSWAATGAGLVGKSRKQMDAEEGLRQVAACREGVLWFLGQRLQLCGQVQATMMQTRLKREVEKNRSVLAKARLDAKLGGFPGNAAKGASNSPRGQNLHHEPIEEEQQRASNELTDEQLQMFEKGNQDMLKQYETTLDKVRTAETSLVEISELQKQLVDNLEVQAAHVDQLVADSLNTTENVEKGNKELKKALERPSTARYTFFAASGLCLFMIVWDLLI